MALSNPKLFGLNVLSYFADVEDKNAALTALNLPPLDLEVIDGSANSTSRQDWVSLSKLNTPLYKTLSRFDGDSSIYESALEDRAGLRGTLFGGCLLYTSPSPRDVEESRMPSSA